MILSFVPFVIAFIIFAAPIGLVLSKTSPQLAGWSIIATLVLAYLIKVALGDAFAMTTSIEQAFGARTMVRGFLLNNQLTDFSFAPRDADGRAVANRVEGGKRPRSSMSPTIVFGPDGLRFVLGPSRWMVVVHEHDDANDTVGPLTVQDARSSTAATQLPSLGTGGGPWDRA